MAGRGTIVDTGQWVRARVVALLLALTLAVPLSVVAAQTAEPRLGDAVPYFGPEGEEAAAIVVEELIDPFRSYDPNSPPERGTHFVLLRLAIENTGGRTLPIDPSAVALQDTLGFLVYPQYVNRGPEATEIDPDLVYSEIAAGKRPAACCSSRLSTRPSSPASCSSPTGIGWSSWPTFGRGG
jgi:hypothetical protein